MTEKQQKRLEKLKSARFIKYISHHLTISNHLVVIYKIDYVKDYPFVKVRYGVRGGLIDRSYHKNKPV